MRPTFAAVLLLVLLQTSPAGADEVRLLSPPPAAPPSLGSIVVPRKIAPPPQPAVVELSEAQKLQLFRDEWVRSFPTEGLPPDAPAAPILITVDAARNLLYLFHDGVFVGKAPVATGMDTVVKRGRREWLFRTPRGLHLVQKKVKDPIWTKPDWAYVEEHQTIPPANDPSRKVKGKMGRYALDLGDSILIHGTDDPKTIGTKASHGCVRVGNKMLTILWREAAVGTPVYIF